MVVVVLLCMCFLYLLGRIFRRGRRRGPGVGSCCPGKIISWMLHFLREVYPRVHQIIKISSQSADHRVTIPVSAVLGICLLPVLPAPLLPFHLPFPSVTLCPSVASLKPQCIAQGIKGSRRTQGKMPGDGK